MKLRLLILVTIIGFAAVAVGWVYERSLRAPEEKADLVIPNDIDYFLTNMNYRALNAEGKLDFQFYTPRLEHFPHNNVSLIEVPSMQIETDTDPWLVDSLAGEYQHANNLLRLTQQVVMQRHGESPMQIYTESIRFEPDRELVTAESDILTVVPRARIRADYAEFDLARKIYKFTRTRSVYKNENS
jgi:lipopolysaccharide export system protein LptC